MDLSGSTEGARRPQVAGYRGGDRTPVSCSQYLRGGRQEPAALAGASWVVDAVDRAWDRGSAAQPSIARKQFGFGRDGPHDGYGSVPATSGQNVLRR